MQKKPARKELTEKALRVFLLHFYSLEWLLKLLLEKRCTSLMTNNSVETLKEDDLILCIKAGIQVFPTARGLEKIDEAVRGNYYTIYSERNDNDFKSLDRSFCTATRYRMSLFTLADRARERHNDDLSSLWVIAATAKLNHVSAYQAYAAAKEEETRLLNYMDEAEYWNAEKRYAGDIAKAQFDPRLMMVQKFKESRDKQQAFRSYLQSKADKSLHEIISTCDLSGHMLAAIWCNIKAHSSQYQVTSSMWKIASELCKTPLQMSLANSVRTNALDFGIGFFIERRG